jgi:hypothetical protein
MFPILAIGGALVDPVSVLDRATSATKKPKPHGHNLSGQPEGLKPARPPPVGFGLRRHIRVQL